MFAAFVLRFTKYLHSHHFRTVYVCAKLHIECMCFRGCDGKMNNPFVCNHQIVGVVVVVVVAVHDESEIFNRQSRQRLKSAKPKPTRRTNQKKQKKQTKCTKLKPHSHDDSVCEEIREWDNFVLLLHSLS